MSAPVTKARAQLPCLCYIYFQFNVLSFLQVVTPKASLAEEQARLLVCGQRARLVLATSRLLLAPCAFALFETRPK